MNRMLPVCRACHTVFPEEDSTALLIQLPCFIPEDGDFMQVRMDFYHKRKKMMCEKLLREKATLDNKTRFILMILNNESAARALALAVTTQISRYCNSSFRVLARQIWLYPCF